MNTNIKIINDTYHIEIPIALLFEDKSLKRFVDFLKIRQTALKSSMSDDEIINLSDEIKDGFWQSGKKDLLSESDS